MSQGCSIIVGGTSGIGLRMAEILAKRGGEVIITGRDAARTQGIAAKIGGNVKGLGLDLAVPSAIAGALAGVGPVKNLVLAAIERDDNTVKNFNIERATRLVTLKMVGYTEAIHTLVPRLSNDSAILLFGGLAKERPYPGSTTVTTVNGGVSSMIRTLAVELAPIRVNAIHPGIVGDTPAWSGKPPEVLERVRVRTPIGRLSTTEDVANAAIFLLDNGSVNGINLPVDGGWLLL
ncbi:MAG: SDR family oxidoreductase [Rhodospirillales bacterium]|nr:SDR family oxidoreductase [Rhodospirillales bacterium]